MNGLEYVYQCRAERVIDGDTVYLLIDLGFSTHTAVRARLHGIDAPELTGETKKEGLASKAYLEKLLEPWQFEHGAVLLCRVYKRKSTSRGTDKYGRWLMVLWSSEHSDGKANTINQQMLEAGHAEPFMLD